MSLTDTISKPCVAKDLRADSLPDPIPFIITSTLPTPIFLAVRDIASATFEAAKGVAFFVPLNPTEPALFQAKTEPFESVRVIIVLLYEEEI